MASDGREVELKYALDDPDAARELVAADTIAGLRAGPWRTLEITDRYIDTQDRRLQRAGYGARLRLVDRHTSLTLKTNGNGDSAGRAALHDRGEIDGRANQKLDPAQWPPSEARSRLEDAARGASLRVLFTIDQHRTERDLLNDEGSVVATLSVDESEVEHRGRRLGSFMTLEVEAASGVAAADGALDAIASELESSGVVRAESRSKLAIGTEMVESERASSQPPRKPGIKPDDTVAEAGRKVLRLHLLRMLAAEPASIQGDVEAVHKMRVATRRMRAAWRVFDGAYRAKPQKRYVNQLRVVATALGRVRDLDVQLERLDAYRQGISEQTAAGLSPLVEEWQREREVARRDLIDLLESSEYEKFVADYRDFVDTPGSASADQQVHVRDTAASRIWRSYEVLRAHDASLPYADAAAIHRVRIDGKRARYTLEFFREILPDLADVSIAELTALQDHLGLLNDAQLAATFTREWLLENAAEIPATTRKSIAGYLTASERDQARLRRSFGRLWRRVAGHTFRRRLALAVSET